MNPTRPVFPNTSGTGTAPPGDSCRDGYAWQMPVLATAARRWCAGCLPVGRRHRAPPKSENVCDAHHRQVQQSATADSLDRLAQERPSLRITIYTTLWR